MTMPTALPSVAPSIPTSNLTSDVLDCEMRAGGMFLSDVLAVGLTGIA